ncbi:MULTISPECIES: teichuronic acid biosynthesis protein TuaB [Niallia]|uniref:MOP flippase family protein n=1 Tax=Niallia circulans TaxID=1397 RepID=A0A941GCZ0_NIACI|nr:MULTISPECIES: MOP flippase family protein [Niallia]MCB5238256.1 MOP flippase family protein [Niallia circulans]MDU1844572.1 MOP flippase family protein [Niallia nealsonii]MED3795063.1 MOP flippase family protein [Niallia alba]
MDSIKSQINSGAKWTSISTLVITLLQIGQFIILGNLMSAKEFGMIGMLTTITIFAQIFVELGLGAAVIQKHHATARQLSTLFWINILLGILICLFMQAASPIIADYFQTKELEGKIRLLSILFLIAPIGQQSQYLMQRDLSFQLLGKVETISTIFSFSLLIGLLFLTEQNPVNVYVWSQVSLYSLKGILYYICYLPKWKPSFVLDIKDCKEFFSFGIYQLLSRLVNRLGSNIDMLLIGRFIGMEALGLYNLVYQIVTIPVLKLNPIITRVAFPVFAKDKNNNQALETGYLHMTKLLAIVSFPLLLGLYSVSDLVIPLFFGEQWIEAIPILQIMIIVGILRVLMNPNGSIILAKGKANIAFYWDLGVLVCYGAALLAAVRSNQLEIVAWAYVGVSILNFIGGRMLLTRMIGLQLKSYVKVLLLPFILAGVSSGIALLLKNQMISIHNNLVWAFIWSVLVSGISYLLLLHVLKKLEVREEYQ